MEQKLNECPYTEHWLVGDTGREDILSAGSMSSMINDKGGKLNMAMMWVAVDLFKLYGLHIADGSLPNEVNGYADYLVIMNKAALKAFDYTRREDASVKGGSSFWSSIPNGKIVEGGLSLMSVQAIIEDYYSGHLTAGKKPIIYMIFSAGINAQCRISCVPRKEKQLVGYLEKCRENIYNSNEFSYRRLKGDIRALYQGDCRIVTVFTLLATISIFISALGLFGLSLFDIRQRHREVAIRKANGARLRNLYSILSCKYIWIIGGAILFTMSLSYYLIHIYTSDFVVKTPVSISIFVIASLVVVATSAGTLFWQVNKAARINPAEIIEME